MIEYGIARVDAAGNISRAGTLSRSTWKEFALAASYAEHMNTEYYEMVRDKAEREAKLQRTDDWRQLWESIKDKTCVVVERTVTDWERVGVVVGSH